MYAVTNKVCNQEMLCKPNFGMSCKEFIIFSTVLGLDVGVKVIMYGCELYPPDPLQTFLGLGLGLGSGLKLGISLGSGLELRTWLG